MRFVANFSHTSDAQIEIVSVSVHAGWGVYCRTPNLPATFSELDQNLKIPKQAESHPAFSMILLTGIATPQCTDTHAGPGGVESSLLSATQALLTFFVITNRQRTTVTDRTERALGAVAVTARLTTTRFYPTIVRIIMFTIGLEGHG